MTLGPLGPVAVLVPVKSFAAAKRRLAAALNPDERADLMRSMAGGVLDAAGDLPVAVVSDDRDVVAWAEARGALALWEPGRGLNRAVERGVARLGEAGAARVVVAHADLPLATSLGWVASFPGVTLVPDRRDDGTNVACVPTSAGFRFAYGPGSFRRHGAEAHRLSLALRVVRHPLLGVDVDIPSDLAAI